MAAAPEPNQPAKEPVTASAKPAEGVSGQQTTSQQSQEARADPHPPLFEDYLAEPAAVPPCPKCQAICVVRLPAHWAGSQFHCNHCAHQWWEHPAAAYRLLGGAEGAQNQREVLEEPNAIAAQERVQERERLEAEKFQADARARAAEGRLAQSEGQAVRVKNALADPKAHPLMSVANVAFAVGRSIKTIYRSPQPRSRDET